jgi:hypothetical protein
MDRPRSCVVCAAVQGFLWKLPVLRRLSPVWRGGLKSLGPIIVVAAGLSFMFISARVSTDESGTVAQIGAAFLIAYGVETTWVIRETNERSGFYQAWLGLITGFAVCGLSGIVLAAALASSSGTSDIREVAFAWSCGSILMLGVIVAVTPVLTYEWRRQMTTEFDDE